MSKRIVLGIPIILLLAVVMILLLLPTEEEKIEFLFYELSEVASKTEDASTLSDAMVVKDFRELFYSHEDDYRFQFEDFTNVKEVNRLLKSLNLETIDDEATLRHQLKELKFQFFKIGE